MLNNKKVNVILSIIIAVCIWAYVIGETEPEDTKTFHNVPITFVNEESLELSNLAVLDTSSKIVDVTVKGKRVDLNKVEMKDIIANVDLSDAALGKNELKIEFKTPDDIEIEDESLSKVSVTVEHKAYKDVDIIVAYDGQFESNQEPLIVEMGKTIVTVSGAESKVRDVEHVRAMVSANDVEAHLKTLSCELVPIDKDGVEIENINLSSNTVKLTTALVSTKTVPLEVPVVDESDDKILRHASVPKTITIKGKLKELEKIEKITSEPVDITGITEDTSIPIEFVLPDDIQVSDKSYVMTAKVTVEKLEDKDFEFSPEEIELKNVGEGLNSEILTEGVKVSVSGKGDILDQINKDNLKLYVDLKDLDEGEHEVEVKFDCNKDYASIDINPENIKINLEKN